MATVTINIPTNQVARFKAALAHRAGVEPSDFTIKDAKIVVNDLLIKEVESYEIGIARTQVSVERIALT